MNKGQHGFTLIEMLVVIGLFAILTTLVVINVLRPQNTLNYETQVQTLKSDIKRWQARAMLGETTGESSAQDFGILFSGNSYTMFVGSSYSASDQRNFTVNLTGPVVLSTNFPGNTLLFETITGEVNSFSPPNNTITITNTTRGDSTVLSLNRYGVISEN